MLLLLAAWSCEEREQRGWTAGELATVLSLSPLPELPPDATNRVADDTRAARLGQLIFFDPRFSKDGSVSCATCHKPQLYFTDGQARAVGMGMLERHTPSVVGSQWLPFLFWDGRKDSLWSQALAPFEGELEHGTTRLDVVHRVAQRYRDDYEEIFGPLPELADDARFPASGMPVAGEPHDPRDVAWRSMRPADRDAVDEVYADVGKCIAAYERQLVPRPGRFDHYVAALREGDETGGGHLSESELRGLRSFIGEAGCIHCHNGPLFTDFAFHNNGLPPAVTAQARDSGRAEGARLVLEDPFRTSGRFSDSDGTPDLLYLNAEFEDFQGAYHTPSLRNVAATAPYGHAGQFATLAELLEFYKRLPRVPMVGHRDMILKPLGKAISVEDLTAFLGSLTGPLPDVQWLVAPPE